MDGMGIGALAFAIARNGNIARPVRRSAPEFRHESGSDTLDGRNGLRTRHVS